MADQPKKKPKPRPKPRPAAAGHEPAPSPPASPIPAAAATPPVGKGSRKRPVEPGQPAARPKAAGAHPRSATNPPPASEPVAEPNELASTDEVATSSFLVFTALPSWLTSTLVHIIVLLILALLTLPPIKRPNRENELILGDNNDVVESLEEFPDQALDSLEIDAVVDTTETFVEANEELFTENPIVSPAMDLTSAPVKVDLDPLNLTSVSSSDLGQPIGAFDGNALSGRGAVSKARMLREGGGTPGSEAAVASALRWLEQHQMTDGSWSLDHKKAPGCRGRCPDIGKKVGARCGATALALLPFLGSGQTHQEGEYQAVVEKGLKYLSRSIAWQGLRGSLAEDEGYYYSHGLCAIVFCEAYAMTKDKTLMTPAQGLINEIAWAQDPVGGGWRYKPRQPGDTSVVGFQLMALKSANMAYLNVPRQTIAGVSRFLDSVQSKDGANYGYTDPTLRWRNSTAAVGLLCRMYLGWKREHPSITAGVAHLSELGPDETDVYYNYYATQVMRHHGGEVWTKWNDQMRDQLVNAQEKEGHAAGSWYFQGGHANESGGRLYCTAMATMILEVYYRHLPLYQKQAAEEDFPL